MASISGNISQEQIARLNKVREFVWNLNTKFIINNTPTNQYINEQLVTPEMVLKYWMPAFTHVTAEPSNGKNYETLEYFGDSVLDCEFAELLSEKMPEGSELLYTEITNAYTKNEYLSKVSDSLGMPSIILTKGMNEIDDRIKADLVEAFIGALVKAGNNININGKITRGFGYALASNFVNYIFGSLDLDVDKGRGAPKTNVEQIFTRFKIVKPEATFHREGGMMVAEIYLNEDQINFLITAKIKIPGNTKKLLIGTGRAREKNPAEASAFENALNYLDSIGANPKWAEDLKNAKEMNSIPKETRDKAFAKATRAGFVSMYFMVPPKTNSPDGFTMLLIGVYADGTRDTLLGKYYPLESNRGTTSAEYAKARSDIIAEYASN